MKTWIILNDIQMPFQDQPVLELVLSFVDKLKPDGVILNGDIVDCFSLSSHRRDSKELKQSHLQIEIAHAQRLMKRLSHIKEKWWIGGNHEHRFYNHIQDKAPELGLVPGLDFPTIFGLGEHGFRWKNYGDFLMLGRLMVTHGIIVRGQSAYSAKAHFDKYGTSVIIGHTHRMGWYCHTNVAGAHGAWENGCLCKLDGLGYTNTKFPDWQQGFAVVHVGEKGFFNVQQQIILDRKQFFYGGELWTR
jgi:predicted phosphodiesterase